MPQRTGPNLAPGEKSHIGRAILLTTLLALVVATASAPNALAAGAGQDGIGPQPAEAALGYYGRRLVAVVRAFETLPDSSILPLLTFLASTAITAVVVSMLVRWLLARSHLGHSTTSLLARRLVPRGVALDGRRYSRLRRRVAVMGTGVVVRVEDATGQSAAVAGAAAEAAVEAMSTRPAA